MRLWTPPPPSGPSLALPLIILLLTSTLSGCDMGFPGSEGEAELDRDTFVETYVELRVAAAGWEGAQLPEEERDRILESQGVSADQLREFVQVHGRNVPFMNEIWNEVSQEVTTRLDPPDPAEEEGTPPPAPDDGLGTPD